MDLDIDDLRAVLKELGKDVSEKELIESMDQFTVLKALVSGLRSYFPQRTPEQHKQIGLFLLHALWLGEGAPVEEVLTFNEDEPARVHLRVVK